MNRFSGVGFGFRGNLRFIGSCLYFWLFRIMLFLLLLELLFWRVIFVGILGIETGVGIEGGRGIGTGVGVGGGDGVEGVLVDFRSYFVFCFYKR